MTHEVTTQKWPPQCLLYIQQVFPLPFPFLIRTILLASHFLPVKLTKVFKRLTLNAADSVYNPDNVGTTELGRGLIHSILFLMLQLSQGIGQNVTPIDRADLGSSDLHGRSTRVTREFFRRTDSRAFCKPGESEAPLPPQPLSSSELARALTAPGLAVQVWAPRPPLADRVPSGTLSLGFGGDSYLTGSS